MKNSNRLKHAYVITVTRILPPLFMVLAIIRSFASSSGDSPAILPLESTTLLLLIFLVFGLSEIMKDAPQLLRMGAILGGSAIPGIVATIGGWFPARLRIPGTILLVIPFMVDIAVAGFLHSPVGAVMDVIMIALIICATVFKGREGRNRTK